MCGSAQVSRTHARTKVVIVPNRFGVAPLAVRTYIYSPRAEIVILEFRARTPPGALSITVLGLINCGRFGGTRAAAGSENAQNPCKTICLEVDQQARMKRAERAVMHGH